MNLAASNPIVDTKPVLGSNGEKYYYVHPQNSQIGFMIDESTSQPSGWVKCRENYILGDGYLDFQYAYHRVFAYMPKTDFLIQGYETYRINSNTFFTLYSNNGVTDRWKNIGAVACSDKRGESALASDFTVQFPFYINIFVKDLPIDGKLVIPQAMIAGYTRIFQDVGVPNIEVPADKAMIKLNLASEV